MDTEPKRIFLYTVVYDDGFAPNPFHGVCSLATCKPDIRRTARIGDIVLGKAKAPNGLRAVYAMEVDEIIAFDEYWRDARFALKKPRINGSLMMACGDNIYHRPRCEGEWAQAHSYHSEKNGKPNPKNVRHDTGKTDRVLLSRNFKYFGANGPDVPKLLDADIANPIRKMRYKFTDRDRHTLTQWLGSLKGSGQMYEPSDWAKIQGIQ